MRRGQGFSLIELLIAMSIILIIVAIAIPRLLRTKTLATEAVIASVMKEIRSTNALYSSLYNQGYAGSLAQLGPPSGACASVSSACANLLDSVLSGVLPATPTPIKSGYRFTYYAPDAQPSPAAPNFSFAAVATPVPGSDGVSTFCVDSRQILRDTAGAQTNATGDGCAATWPIGGTIGPL